MQTLRQNMIAFASEVSGLPQSTYDKQQDEELKHENYLDWDVMLSDPYKSAGFNEWPWKVYELVVQLIKELNEENVDMIEQRFIQIRKYYYQNRGKVKGAKLGVGYEYERAYNTTYYSK